MPEFVTLPSGLVVNLMLVSRMIQTDEHGEPTLAVHFAGGDLAVLRSQDASALRKWVRSSTALSSNVKTTVFWLVILSAVAAVWMAIHTLN